MVVVAIDELQSFLDVLQSDAARNWHALLVFGVGTFENNTFVNDLQADMDETWRVVAHTMLEGILHKDGQDERWHLIAVGQVAHLKADVHPVGIAQSQQMDVAADKLSLLGQRYGGVASVVE